MCKIKIEMKLDLKDEKAIEEFKKLEHHIEYLVNIEDYPEIERIYDVKVKRIIKI